MALRIEKAMVLAAGYGTRLRPLTERIPKPLVPVAGRPMISYALDRLKAHGVRDVVVNVSHLKEPLMSYLADVEGLNVRISEESEPLETGGGIKRALPALGDAAFFTINSDVIWEDDRGTALDRLAENWEDARMDVLLLVQPKATAVGYDKGEDHVFVKSENTIGWDERESPYIIAGVGVLHPRIFQGVPNGKFSVKVVWREALLRNRLFCLPHRGRWFQTGSLADIERVEALGLLQNLSI